MSNHNGKNRRQGAGEPLVFNMPIFILFSAIITLLLFAFGSLQYYLPLASVYLPRIHNTPYNFSTHAHVLPLSDGGVKYRILVITDLDHNSKADAKNWQSFMTEAWLTVPSDREHFKVEWDEPRALKSQISAGGRGMELSDLVYFDGKLLSVDDRTGLLYRIDDLRAAIPWIFLNDGPGNTTKGFKGEWMTVKEERLYVGGLGKEWTTPQGEFVNNHPMYVKVVERDGSVLHVDWTEYYKRLRGAVGIEYPGYMIHESGQWSAVHRKWFFLPRRASKSVYSEDTDEQQGTNLLLIADEHFKAIQVKEVGSIGDGSRGFSAFQFLPGSGDSIIVALKSQEKDGVAVASYLSVLDAASGRVLLDEQPVGSGPYKYEGLAFL